MKRTIELLPQVSFSIMVALSLRPRHGYEIIQQVQEDSMDKIHLGPGALYGTLQKLLDEGLIEELPAEDPAERRRYYRLTARGHQRLAADLEYYAQATRLAGTRLAEGWANS